MSVQKTKHLRLIRLHIKGIEITPVEAPAELPEEPTLDDLHNAYEDLVERLLEAGILVPAGNAPENVYGIPGDGIETPAPEQGETPAEEAPADAPQEPAGALQDGETPAA